MIKRTMNDRIDAKSAKDSFDQGKVQLLDVRTEGEYGSMNIEGSVLMPLGCLDAAKVKEMSKKGPCVIVCHSGMRAQRALKQLAGEGCKNLMVMNGGIVAWKRAGLPVNRRGPISLERQVRVATGLLVIAGVFLGVMVHPAFFMIAGFTGAGLTFAGLTGWCGMALLIAKAPWNEQEEGCEGKSCSA